MVNNKKKNLSLKKYKNSQKNFKYSSKNKRSKNNRKNNRKNKSKKQLKKKQRGGGDISNVINTISNDKNAKLLLPFMVELKNNIKQQKTLYKTQTKNFKNINKLLAKIFVKNNK